MILRPLYYPITRHCTALIHRNTLVRCSCKKNKGIYHLEFSVPVVSVTEECHDFTRKTRILFRVSPHPPFFSLSFGDSQNFLNLPIPKQMDVCSRAQGFKAKTLKNIPAYCEPFPPHEKPIPRADAQ